MLNGRMNPQYDQYEIQLLTMAHSDHSGTAYPTASGLPFLGTGYATGTLGLAPKSSDSVLLDVTLYQIGLPLPKAIWPQNLSMDSMARLFILDYFGTF